MGCTYRHPLFCFFGPLKYRQNENHVRPVIKKLQFTHDYHLRNQQNRENGNVQFKNSKKLIKSRDYHNPTIYMSSLQSISYPSIL